MIRSASMPPLLDLPLIDLLREDLRESGFTVGGVEDAVGPLAAAALHREQALPALRATALTVTSEPRLVLTRLFVLGQNVPSVLLDGALPRLRAAGAVRLGLVGFVDGGTETVGPLLDLRPYSAVDASGLVDWWLASDLGELATGERLSGDHVLGAGGASVTLAQVAMRTPRARVLDLGTGCGIQALHASRHADSVVATDLSERALHFAAFNAALDGVRLDLRAGSMLEPVVGETFDLVVSNPPFVITPRREATDGAALPTYEYRDGGRSGDDLIRDLVTGVGSVLAPGGVAQMLGNWEHRHGEPWTDRVGRWLDESGLDGWVIQREVLDPAEYAETWIRDGGTTPEREPEVWATAYAQWLDDFASRGVEAIGFGIIMLRRPENAMPVTMRRLEEHAGSVRQPLGSHLAACLAAHDWLQAHDDAALADTRLTTAADVTEERFYTPGAADPNIVIVRQGDGLGRGVQSSTGLSALVGACDGELTVGQIIAAIAAIFEVSAADLSAELLPAVRSLIRDGFLLVV